MRQGCSATMNSAYTGEPLAQIAIVSWKMNVIGTTLCNCCGPDTALVKSERKMTKKGTDSFVLHKRLPLCITLRLDNNIVTILLNYHSLVVFTEDKGVFCRKKTWSEDTIESALSVYI